MALLVGQPVAVEGAALVVLLFHLHLVQRAEARLLVVWGWRAGRRAVAGRRRPSRVGVGGEGEGPYGGAVHDRRAARGGFAWPGDVVGVGAS